MLKETVQIKKPSTIKEWVQSIPLMVCAADTKLGKKRMSAAQASIDPIQKALTTADHQLTMIGVCDLVEGAKGLKTVGINIDMESDDEGGSYPSLGVNCAYSSGSENEDEHEHENEDGESIEDEMQDLLSNEAHDLYGSTVTERSMAPQDFLKQLAKDLMGESEGPIWLAARESHAISEATNRASTSRKGMRRL